MNFIRKIRTSVLLLAGLGLLLAPFTATNLEAKTIKWKLQAVYPSSSPSYEDSVLVVINKIKERTKGRLDIEAFPANALFPAKEIFNAVKRGLIPIGVTSPAYMQANIKLAGIAAGVPYSFKRIWEGVYFYKRLGFEDMLREEFKTHGMFYATDRIYQTELVLKKKVSTYKDFDGLKLRSAGVLQKYFNKLGAAAAYLPGAEVYPALASGVVEGAHWGAAQGAYKMGFYDIAKFHLLPAFNISGTDAWIINLKALGKLPKDIQQIIKETLEEHFWWRTNQYAYQEAITLAKAQKEKGVTVVTLDEKSQQEMTKVAQEMWELEAQKGPEAKKAIETMKNFLRELGYL